MAFYIACGFLQKQVQMSFYLGIEDDQLINWHIIYPSRILFIISHNCLGP
jgi:hypothetical protein